MDELFQHGLWSFDAPSNFDFVKMDKINVPNVLSRTSGNLADKYNKHCFFCLTSHVGFIKTDKTVKLCTHCAHDLINKSIIFSPLMVHGYEMFFDDHCDLCSRKFVLVKDLPKASAGFIIPACNFELHVNTEGCKLLQE